MRPTTARARNAAARPISARAAAERRLPAHSSSCAYAAWLVTSTEPSARQPSEICATPGVDTIGSRATNQSGACVRAVAASRANATRPSLPV